MEMAESTAAGKPIWGIEIYDQPDWPAEYIALQNWGMLAHGMTNDLTFAWKPYSDFGIPTEPHAWEKPGAKGMQMILDTDGTKLPSYFAYVRSNQEIRDFHRRSDGLSLKRTATTVGFYVSPDTGNYFVYETGNAPWDSVWEHTHFMLIYALRMAGMTVTYLDDTTLPAAPGTLKTIIVPASYVLSQPAAEKLASFARAGGNVILAGMSGVVDPWLAKYPNIGGEAWAELNWQAPDFKPDPVAVSFLKGVPADARLRFLGTGIGNMPGATPLTDAQGQTVGWERAWGQGKLLAYGVLPDTHNSPDPHVSPELMAWLDQWRQCVDLPITGRWVSGGEQKLGLVGTGSEVVDLVVREKSPSEKFVFCLNQGGAGAGTAEVPVGPGDWRATDALTGETLPGGFVAAGVWKAPLSLPPFGYRVIRLAKP
jgi:hypothetical protein